jgi:5-(carboxyamino)imidazole ribonucleotide mutase
MGSKGDLDFAIPIGRMLERLNVHYEYRVASAHKTPNELLRILEEYERTEQAIVYITVAGLSNALSGVVDAQTKFPVIACPPYSEKFAGNDILSSLRMPSGVSPLVVLNPESAGLAAAKILALEEPDLAKRIIEGQLAKRRNVNVADGKVKGRKVAELTGG